MYLNFFYLFLKLNHTFVRVNEQAVELLIRQLITVLKLKKKMKNL